jgi:diacylglycerol kinase family enzyme
MAEAPVERIAVVRNPKSGTALEKAKLEQALLNAQVSARIFDAPSGDAFAPWLDRLAEDFDVLVAAGGDGTVAAVANAVFKARRTLAIIPTGTLNHFARDTGIPTDLDAALDVIRTGRDHAFDAGSVNGHLFLNNVSLGNYPRMVNTRIRIERRGVPHRLAGALAAARTWWHLRKLTAAISIDGRDLIRRSPFIVIANGSYKLAGLSLSSREEVNDGKLSLYVAPPTGRFGALSLPFRALIGTLESHDEFESLCASAISIATGHQRVSAGVDGEVRVFEAPLEFALQRQALRVRVPRHPEP